MSTAYHLNAGTYRLTKFRTSLETRELLPSRRVLRDNLKANFRILASEGLVTLADLFAALRSTTRIEQFSRKTGLTVEYLKILKREAGSYFPNPVPLRKFAGIHQAVLSALEEMGVKNSKHLFDLTVTPGQTTELCSRLEVGEADIAALIGLCDLSRLYGVGPAFARILFDIGIVSVAAFRSHTPDQIVGIYEKVTKKKADFSAKDVQFALDMAHELT